MELLMSIAIGTLTGSALYLLLRETTFSVILGLTLFSYAVNLLLFASGRLAVYAPPLMMQGVDRPTDPLPQALVLTAIVIAFGMTAYLVALALRAKGESGTDHVDAGDDRL